MISSLVQQPARLVPGGVTYVAVQYDGHVRAWRLYRRLMTGNY
jgi:hypothetical protein